MAEIVKYTLDSAAEVGMKKPDWSLLEEGYVYAGKTPDGFHVFYKEVPKGTKFGNREDEKRDANGHYADFRCCTNLWPHPAKDYGKNKSVSVDWLG